MTARLRVDRTRCAGYGICALLAPAALDLDPWGFPEILEEEPDDLRRARRAVAACPRGALTLEESPVKLQSLGAALGNEALG